MDQEYALHSPPSSPPPEDEPASRRQLANLNERRRMQAINAGFESLRRLLPLPAAPRERLSKAGILHEANEYITALRAALQLASPATLAATDAALARNLATASAAAAAAAAATTPSSQDGDGPLVSPAHSQTADAMYDSLSPFLVTTSPPVFVAAIIPTTTPPAASTPASAAVVASAKPALSAGPAIQLLIPPPHLTVVTPSVLSVTESQGKEPAGTVATKRRRLNFEGMATVALLPAPVSCIPAGVAVIPVTPVSSPQELNPPTSAACYPQASPKTDSSLDLMCAAIASVERGWLAS